MLIIMYNDNSYILA